jgi:fructokinase
LLKEQATPAIASSPSVILLFGELLLDCFPDREIAGGAPFNVARHLRGFGAASGLFPVLVTRIGKDARADRLLEAIHCAGLAMDGVQRDSLHATGHVRITVDDDTGGHRFEIAPGQAWDFIHAGMARLTCLSRHPQWIYFGTLAQRFASRRALRALLRTSRARGFLDINLRDPWVRKDVLRWSLGKAEIVKVNEEELRRIAAMLGFGSGAPRALGECLLNGFGIRQLLVTQGDQGAWLLGGDGGYFHTPDTPPIRDSIDSVGAGDAFSAVYLLGMTQGWHVEQILERAHRFAGEICRLRGAIPDNDDFYRPFIEAWQLTKKATP